MALKLKRHGVSRVYPMIGGIESWIEQGFIRAVETLFNGPGDIGQRRVAYKD
ncbi:MAG: hypothetical protein IIB71_15550, partial [Proteobacteria bacterium]|nr:hypothetical protein [Pseudomonadota bacterium]